MARKAIYWRNPELHRAERRRRVRYLVALGIRYADQISPAAREVRRLTNIKWCQTHRAANRKAQLKYRRKLQRLFGRCTAKAIWLHTQLRAQENAKKRKAAIALLPRKLVESRQRMHLVSRRQMYARRYAPKGWGLVFLGRNAKLPRPLRLSRSSRSGTCDLL